MPLVRKYQALITIIDRTNGFCHESSQRTTLTMETFSQNVAKKEFLKSATSRAEHSYGIPKDSIRVSVSDVKEVQL